MPSINARSLNLISFLALYQSGFAVNGTDSICNDDVCNDDASLLQVKVERHDKEEWDLLAKSGSNWDIVFVDLPMNFGEDIAKWAAFGADAPKVDFGDEAPLARNSTRWAYRGGLYSFQNKFANAPREHFAKLAKLMKPGRPLWGPLNPKLQAFGAFNPELPGLTCPLFYTPQKYWPKDIAEEYFGSDGTKERFANLRNPFEMITAIFRMSHDMLKNHTFGVCRGYNVSRNFGDVTIYSNDGMACTNPDDGMSKDINAWVKHVIPNMASFQVPKIPVEVGCYLQPQAPFFDGPYGITHPLDMREFPRTATEYFEKHGIDVKPGIRPNDLMHVRSCDNTWAGDFDDEAKALVLKYYERDFELACEHFGHCDFTEPVCNQHIPGMCPDKVFTWDEAAGKYHRK